jgi:hypothetical protein
VGAAGKRGGPLTGPDPSAAGSAVDSTAYQSVADAYYRKEIGAAATARTNSQSAYAIAAAVAAAVFAAGAFADLKTEPIGVQIVGAGALVAWLLAAALFMRAVAAPDLRISSEPREVTSELDFMRAALTNAKNETETINKRQTQARLVAAVASFLTLLAIALVLFLSPPDPSKDITVRLSPADQTRLTTLCGKRVPKVINGSTDPSTFNEEAITIDPVPSQCKPSGSIELQKKKTVYILAP